MTKIAIIATNNREKGVIEAIELLGVNPVKDRKVILKPNFNTADSPPGSTDSNLLRSLITKLYDMGASSITIAERSGPADTAEVFAIKGLNSLSNELGFDIVNLAEVPVEEYVLIEPENSHWEEGFLFAKIYKEAECIVETGCIKTHEFGGHFTLSLKNAVGLVPRRKFNGKSYMGELHNSPNMRKMIAEINTAFSPDLIIMDGISIFVDGGPARGTRKEANVMIAGTDRIAVDAVSIAILRMFGTTPEVSEGSIFNQEQIARAVELDLGVKSPTEIELLYNSEESKNVAEKVKIELEK